MKRTVEHREYIEAAAGFSWLESGHADVRRYAPTPVDSPAPDADPANGHEAAAERPVDYTVPAPRRSTT